MGHDMENRNVFGFHPSETCEDIKYKDLKMHFMSPLTSKYKAHDLRHWKKQKTANTAQHSPTLHSDVAFFDTFCLFNKK